jgi:hypothetical protein
MENNTTNYTSNQATNDVEIKTDDYTIFHKVDSITVVCKGSLRLSGKDDYDPIIKLLENVVDTVNIEDEESNVSQESPVITLDLRELEFLNSSGINILSKFVIKVRQKGKIGIMVRGSKTIPWQGKSLKNLERLMPSSLTLELV